MGYGENLKSDDGLTTILKSKVNAAVTRINPTELLSGLFLFSVLLLPQMPIFLIFRIQIAWINFSDNSMSMGGPEFGRQLPRI